MLSTIQQYLFFRCKQAFRVLKDIGLGHLLILAPLIFVGILGVLQVISTSQNIAVAVVVLLMLSGLHWNRSDRFFLEQLPAPLFLFFLLDYLLLTGAVLFCLIFWQKWLNLLILSIGLLLLCIFKPSYFKNDTIVKTFYLSEFRWIPLELFEWRCGLRKTMPGFVLLYGIGLGFSFYAITVPIVVFLLALSVTSFFQFFENKDLLLAVNKHQNLLQIKAKQSLKLFNLFALPLCILFVVFHHTPKHLGALFVILIISNLIILFAIAMKYKNYRFHHQKVYSSLPLAIFVGCLCVPFLWPIPPIMLYNFWKKAQENLSYHYF